MVCGKARCRGSNVQAVLAPGGFPMWASRSSRGSVHDITAARLHALPGRAAAAAGLAALADAGYARHQPGHPHPVQALPQ